MRDAMDMITMQSGNYYNNHSFIIIIPSYGRTAEIVLSETSGLNWLSLSNVLGWETQTVWLCILDDDFKCCMQCNSLDFVNQNTTEVGKLQNEVTYMVQQARDNSMHMDFVSHSTSWADDRRLRTYQDACIMVHIKTSTELRGVQRNRGSSGPLLSTGLLWIMICARYVRLQKIFHNWWN